MTPDLPTDADEENAAKVSWILKGVGHYIPTPRNITRQQKNAMEGNSPKKDKKRSRSRGTGGDSSASRFPSVRILHFALLRRDLFISFYHTRDINASKKKNRRKINASGQFSREFNNT